MPQPSSTPYQPRTSIHPFPRVLCAVDDRAATQAAIEQAIALTGPDARLAFAGRRPEAVEGAVARAREAGVDARTQPLSAARVGQALLEATAAHDLVVVGAHSHSRLTGILLGEIATLLVHRSAIPVLIARERSPASGVVAATRAWPRDRIALTAGARLAARLGAALTVVHVRERDDDRRVPELKAELANVRAMVGREIDYYEPSGPAARVIVDAAQGDGAGLVVVGSDQRRGLSALASVSERVAHLAPCSVLVMRT